MLVSFSDESHVLQLSKCSYHAQAKKLKIRVVDEVPTVHVILEQIKDSNGYQFPIKSVIDVVGALLCRENTFVFKGAILVKQKIRKWTFAVCDVIVQILVVDWTTAQKAL